ncbi:MAG: type II toxin-antitoxin system VapC family toxin [Leptolyngbya sp. SIO4C1]|nr:type II toxin-antitoxin system VapC family toxin [Leptolyngbya sp. SIO4C1]
MKVILDACAVIAFFRDEAGAAVVESYLTGNQYDCMIHSVNLCEVYYDFYRSGGETATHDVLRDLQQAGVIFRQDLTIEFWQQVGKYKATIARIALADCFALTLANRENGVLVTSDRREFEPVVNLNVCPIEFIR